MRAAPIISSFNAGEWSPLLDGRTDLAKYPKSCRKMVNYIPSIQGPAVRRGGTHFVAEIKDSSKRAWLVKFQFNVSQAYAIEFGDFYIRFYANHGQVVNGTTPYEIASPYAAADLTNDDGTFALSYAQSADVIYLYHAKYPPQKLARAGALSWSIAPAVFQAGPFDSQNTATNQIISINASGTNLVSNFDAFTPDMVGMLVYMESQDFSAVPAWEASKVIAAIGGNPNGVTRRVGQRVYQCVTNTVAAGNPIWTGTNTLVHTSGTAWDGDGQPIAGEASQAGVEWLFLHPGYIVFVISGYVNARSVTFTQQSPWGAPADLFTTVAPGGTWRWAFGKWSAGKGWPDLVTFFRNRLVSARSSDQSIDMSVAGDYQNYQTTDFGNVTSDMAISIQVAADQEYNALSWLSAGDSLLIGGVGGEFVCREATANDVLGPDNVAITKQSGYGSRSIPPVSSGSAICYVQKGGRQLMEMEFNIQTNNFDSDDKSVLADHLMIGGLTQLAYQKEVDSIIWAVRSDGLLLGLTYQPKQDVFGWAQYPIGGDNAAVESILTIPAPTLDRSELWMIVRRTINNVTKRYVEYMDRPLRAGDAQATGFYVDGGLVYSGAPVTTINGLDHLEGETVQVLVDGATHPERQVVDGSITLQEASSVVNVGLQCSARLVPQIQEAGSADGTAQGKTQRIQKIVLNLYNSLGGSYGPQDGPYDDVLFRSPNDNMDEAPPLFTGRTDALDWPDGYENGATIEFRVDDPLPSTVVSIAPQLMTYDR